MLIVSQMLKSTSIMFFQKKKKIINAVNDVHVLISDFLIF